jgi:hypothetical protein
MKTSGTITLADLAPGTIKTALTPASQTTTIRSAITVALAIMAESDDPVAIAIKRDGSRILKFNGGDLSGFFPEMVSNGALAIGYGSGSETTKSRPVYINSQIVARAPMLNNGLPGAGVSAMTAILRALTGFDPSESAETPEPVSATPQGILTALSGVDLVEWVMMDQSDSGNGGVPRIIALRENDMSGIEFGYPAVDMETVLSGTASAVATFAAANPSMEVELVEIDLPETPTVTPTGPRLDFE